MWSNVNSWLVEAYDTITLENNLACPSKTELHRTYDLAVTLLDIYPRETFTHEYHKTCIRMS